MVTRQQHPLMKDIKLTHALDLATGFKVIDKGGVSVILLDLNLPDSKGLDTLRSVKDKTPETPVIIFTGTDDDATMAEALECGACNFLKKANINFNLIAKTILSVLEIE